MLSCILLVYSGGVFAKTASPQRGVYAVAGTEGRSGVREDGCDDTPEGAHTYRLRYRWDEVTVDKTYLDNAANIREIVSHLHKASEIDSISIYAYASPEGVYEHNVRLAELRAAAAKRFILENSVPGNGLDAGKISLHPMAENWDGLREAVVLNYRRWDRDKVLEILDDRSISDATREWRLQQLDGGISWKWMRIHLMPELRAATWVCFWGRTKTELPEAPELPQDRLAYGQDSLVFTPELEHRQGRRTIAALKTNLLYDAVTALNFSVEIPFGKHFSVQYEHVAPWWHSGPYGNKYCLQFLSMGGEARWWFLPRTREWYDGKVLSGEMKQRDALMGHYFGLYGDGGKFDVQVGRKFGCWQTSFWGAGLSYGYSMPVGKLVNMEFSLSVGYMAIDYQHYTPAPDWSVLVKDEGNAGRMHWFGPTKAKVSLVIPLIVKTGRRR